MGDDVFGADRRKKVVKRVAKVEEELAMLRRNLESKEKELHCDALKIKPCTVIKHARYTTEIKDSR